MVVSFRSVWLRASQKGLIILKREAKKEEKELQSHGRDNGSQWERLLPNIFYSLMRKRVREERGGEKEAVRVSGNVL